MLLIRCPHCGDRPELEFNPGGEAHIQRAPLAVDDQGFAEYLYYRDNPKGLTYERWVHSQGCRRWFNAARDTVTHEIRMTYKMGEAAPAAGNPAPAGTRADPAP